jgi:hypothetical protein
VSFFQMPTTRATLDMHWDILNTAADADLGDCGTAPQVQLNNVEMQVGGFLSTLLGPMAEYMRYALLPTEVFVKAVNYPIPGLSDIWQAAFGKDLTILEVANLLGSTGVVPPPFNLIIKAADLASSLEQGFSSLTDAADFAPDLQQTYIPLGGFDFSQLGQGLGGLHDLRQDLPAWGNGGMTDWLKDPANDGTDLTTLKPYATAVGKSLQQVLQNDVPDELKNSPDYRTPSTGSTARCRRSRARCRSTSR